MEVSLELECHLDKDSLHVRYIVTNHGRLPLLSFDGIPGKPIDALWPDLKLKVDISVLGDMVALKRVNPPPPPGGAMVTYSYLPPLSQTLPGQRREVRFQLVEPIAEASPYTPDYPGAQYRQRPVNHVQLYLGCFWKTEGMVLQPFKGIPDAYELNTAYGPQTMLTANCTQTVTVRERIDSGFFRT